MFCGLVGSTALAPRLDTEDWRSLTPQMPEIGEAQALLAVLA